MPTVTAIKSCATTACAFNNGGCTAFAITVGDLMCTAEAVSFSAGNASCLSYEAR